MDTIKISAKMLGELAMETFCPRCFWLRLRCRAMPYMKFPGIAMIIDSYTKRFVRGHFEKHQKSPPFLKPFGELIQCVPVPHHSKFFHDDKETGIRLTGTPDDIFLRSDSSFVITDYKCARWNENQTVLLPMYDVQLNGYAMLAEANGYNPVSQVGLIYFEPQTIFDGDMASVQTAEGFRLSFVAKFVEVELRPQQLILPLLRQARKLADMTQPPPPRDGCKDCQAVNGLVDLLSSVPLGAG